MRGITTTKRRLHKHFPKSKETVVIENTNSIHAFNPLEREYHVERYKCHFRLIDLIRDDLYDMSVPGIEV